MIQKKTGNMYIQRKHKKNNKAVLVHHSSFRFLNRYIALKSITYLFLNGNYKKREVKYGKEKS